jgi:signal transduction histidine kinase
MRLQPKLLLGLFVAATAYAGVIYVGEHKVLYPSYEALENESAERDLGRIREALDNEKEHLEAFCYDWAAWDDSYSFVQDGNEPYIESNLVDSLYEDTDLALLLYIKSSGEVTWIGGMAPEGSEDAFPAGFSEDFYSEGHPFLAPTLTGEPVVGLQDSTWGVMLVCAQPVVPSNNDADPNGSLVMARLLDEEFFDELREQVRVDFKTWKAQDPSLGPQLRSALVHLGESNRSDEEMPIVLEPEDDVLRGYFTVAGIDGPPLLLFRASIPRDITQRGLESIRAAVASTVIGALLLIATLYFLIQALVLRPLGAITAHAEYVGSSDDLERRIDVGRNDELGILSRELNDAFGKLAESRSQLADASRRAGMSEIATNVLHNVGNMLNSVGVSVSQILKSARSEGQATLARAIQLMQEHQEDLASWLTSDPKGKRFPELLERININLEKESGRSVEEVERLKHLVEEMSDLIRSQQNLAGGSDVTGVVHLPGVLEEARTLAIDQDVKDIPVTIKCDAPERLKLSKHRFLQIVVNLVKNALEAVSKSECTEGQVQITANLVGDELLSVTVTDDGVGIASEDLACIFQHGFTTKPGGQGFGLHAAANAATEMNGTLRVDSAGPGCGSSFELRIPVQVKARKAA